MKNFFQNIIFDVYFKFVVSSSHDYFLLLILFFEILLIYKLFWFNYFFYFWLWLFLFYSIILVLENFNYFLKLKILNNYLWEADYLGMILLIFNIILFWYIWKIEILILIIFLIFFLSIVLSFIKVKYINENYGKILFNWMNNENEIKFLKNVFEEWIRKWEINVILCLNDNCKDYNDFWNTVGLILILILSNLMFLIDLALYYFNI